MGAQLVSGEGWPEDPDRSVVGVPAGEMVGKGLKPGGRVREEPAISVILDAAHLRGSNEFLKFFNSQKPDVIHHCKLQIAK